MGRFLTNPQGRIPWPCQDRSDVPASPVNPAVVLAPATVAGACWLCRGVAPLRPVAQDFEQVVVQTALKRFELLH